MTCQSSLAVRFSWGIKCGWMDFFGPGIVSIGFWYMCSYMLYIKIRSIFSETFEYQGLESCLSDLTRFDMCCGVGDAWWTEEEELTIEWVLSDMAASMQSNTIESMQCNAMQFYSIQYHWVCIIRYGGCNAVQCKLMQSYTLECNVISNQMHLEYFEEVETGESHWVATIKSHSLNSM